MKRIIELFSGMEENKKRDLAEAVFHGMLVSNLARRLARELGLPEDRCYTMAVAGMVHDVGKLQVNKYLYGGPDRLDIEQMRYTRTHPTFGFLHLMEEGYDPVVLEAVLHHHENYDGSGYPDNLAGEEIPYEARILRVCDVFAALVSDRAYRKAFDAETAMDLMIDEIKNFDMEIFLAFQRIVADESFCEIKEMVRDANEVYATFAEDDPGEDLE
ncbi:HD-GYP domain-containing protein [Anaerolentibacter hominis]|uniref:HD-GYP domain-containing protein n=1 Tax=Anaerolentibacter hominis TaxID=3079009 RepID=UPI0031B8964B